MAKNYFDLTSDSPIWYPVPDMLRKKYYEVIVSIAKEVELAKQYLGGAYSLGSNFA